MPKPKVTTKRGEEIEDIQNRVRKTCGRVQGATSPSRTFDRVIDKDLESTVYSLELLKGLYRSSAKEANGLHGFVRPKRSAKITPSFLACDPLRPRNNPMG
jgi:hypothetical protein